MSLHQRSSAPSSKRLSTEGHSSSSYGRNVPITPADMAYEVDEIDYENARDAKIIDDLDQANTVVKKRNSAKDRLKGTLGDYGYTVDTAVKSLDSGKDKLKAALEDDEYGYNDTFLEDLDIVNPSVRKLTSDKDKIQAALEAANKKLNESILSYRDIKAHHEGALAQAEVLKDDNRRFREVNHILTEKFHTAKEEIRTLMDETRTITEEKRILKKENRAFTEEIRIFREEHRIFREEHRALKEENRTAKEEIRALKDENGTLKEHTRTIIEEKRILEEENRTAKEETRTAKEEISALKEENVTLKEETCAIIEEKRVAKERIRELEDSIIRELKKESVTSTEETHTVREENRAFKDDIESSNSESLIPANSELVEARYGERTRTVRTSFAAIKSLGPGQDPVGSKFPWLLTVCRSFGEYRNLLSDYLQPKVSPGFVRISWTCRCGRRLRLEVPRNRQAAALAFAEQASGPTNVNTISVTSSSLDEDSQSTSSSLASGSSRSSNPPLDSPRAELMTTEIENSFQRRFFPRGTKMYMLLCVNTGRRLIKLANVDVTDMDDDEKVFNKLRGAYGDLLKKKWYSRLVKPKTMHYIKFRLLYLQKSQECVTHYEVDSIPSIKEVMREEYLYDPCPPEHGDFPIPPDIFMHIFNYPGDHIGMATEMLPKKLYSKVCWINSVHHSRNLPYGWGFYIVEEVDWALVAWWVFGMVVLLTTLTIAWSAVTKDVQGGTGIGSYSIAALALLVSVIILGTRSIEGTVLDS